MTAEDSEPAESQEPTTVGNYFISNYPPYSFWSMDRVNEAHAALAKPSAPDLPLGFYAHIPFCRKRCDFCYFKAYTDKNGAQVKRYIDGLLAELDLYRDKPFLGDRTPDFVYFGGGTPSYLSTQQTRALFEGLQQRLPWSNTREVAFECEPGTLQDGKVQLLRDLGVTRLSLGVENFDPHILEINNRAHRGEEIERAWQFIRDAQFDQVNIDLIAGMVGETEENWQACVERTIELDPESVTIYQMEVPFNTTIYKEMRDGQEVAAPVADWATKRRWVAEAFAALESAGYTIGSAYTAYKGEQTKFLYRDALWHGADLLSLGVSSFSHIGGVHYQNEHSFEGYLRRVEAGELPIHRALALDSDERLIREFILQLKLGTLDTSYFQDKFGVDVRSRFREALARHETDGWLSVVGDEIRTSREGLLRVDQLLPDFFLEKHQNARYA